MALPTLYLESNTEAVRRESEQGHDNLTQLQVRKERYTMFYWQPVLDTIIIVGILLLA